MVQAWYMDEETNDQRLEHHKIPPEYLALEDLHKKTGVEYFEVSVIENYYLPTPHITILNHNNLIISFTGRYV